MRQVDVPRLLERLGIETQRKGRELWAPCPVHEDRDPSWQMRDDPGSSRHGYHRCFGCGFGGGPFALVMRVLDCEPVEARDFLAGHDVERVDVEVRVEARRARRTFEMPPEVEMGRPLSGWPSAARAYLESRGLGGEEVARFGMGYAVDGVLAGRVVVPVVDYEGRLTSYAARSFLGHAKRYLEPPAFTGCDRSAVFGEHLWPPEGERDLLVVVEGPFDAIAADAAGLATGAVRGSSISTEQALSLSTWTRVRVATDPDAAGDKAAVEIAGALARHVADVVRVRPRADLALLLQVGGQAAVREAVAGVGSAQAGVGAG